MTRQQFNQLSQDFALYARKEVSYKSYVPSLNEYAPRTGLLMGIGQEANKDHIIIAHYGHSESIHYTEVKFPK